ncbi:DUF1772 domain-containing protein [Yinghuangia seranimata]|uniref:anthrone oxygenase family protein n=1 Tax=Yinghuangia seranimata TaxID=408067 RepID=UPI00248CD5EA|nr:anthrone oxygenase family protein [Yinghuangia seranimata]MDI2126927.1 DUF1772 domain-containing protein [Yinghuangia seranimata]
MTATHDSPAPQQTYLTGGPAYRHPEQPNHQQPADPWSRWTQRRDEYGQEHIPAPSGRGSGAEAAAGGGKRDALDIVLVAATVAMGLIAGVYYAFSVAVMPGLGATDDRTFIGAMQQINVKIENPLFFASFFGAFGLSLAAAIMQRKRGGGQVFKMIVIGLGLYTLGLVTTMGFNIPLNNGLKDAGDPAAIADPAHVRDTFENPWLVWNAVRALASTAAIGFLGWALVLRGRRG